jgi:N6-L-threonylcarbamoyladenine synthase
MNILSIETSCDETAISIVKITGKPTNLSIKILADALVSQTDIHAEYGGVFPMLAKREHTKNIPVLLELVLKKARMYKRRPIKAVQKGKVAHLTPKEPEIGLFLSRLDESIIKPKIDAIAVTEGPGLEPALWVGINTATILADIWNIPVIPVNHMKGHFLSVLAQKSVNFQFPALALLISGGHTEFVISQNLFDYELLGKTRDDAVGEAYDKVARMLDFKYPGGPQIAKLAEKFRKKKKLKKGEFEGESDWKFPRPMMHSKDLDFSFSGLKTSVLYATRGKKLTETDKENIAGEFEQAIVDVLTVKTKKAVSATKAKTLIVAGGVASNSFIRSNLRALARSLGTTPLFPTKKLSTDNSVMIAIAGYVALQSGKIKTNRAIKASGNLSF